jgi:hypothetical protein
MIQYIKDFTITSIMGELLVRSLGTLLSTTVNPIVTVATSLLSTVLYINSKLLDIYRKSSRELRGDRSISFCVKYLPFSGFNCFRSQLYEEYHLLFFYKNNTTSNDNNIELFFNFISQKSTENENKYIEKCLYLIKYLGEYEKQFDDKLKQNRTTNKIVNKRTTKLAKLFEKKNQSGGDRHEHAVTHTLLSDLFKKTEKKQLSLVRYKNFEGWNKEQRCNFRLNYQIDIDNKYLLYSGDISFKSLYNLVFPLINSRTRYSDNDYEKLFFMKIPFFVNNDLLIKLATHVKISSLSNSIYYTQFAIINFIKEYLKSFLILYMLSKYNVSELIKDNPSKFLKGIYDENLKKTFKKNIKKIFGFENDKNIKKREEINYFAMLMKYSLLCIDHIIKKFKIIILEDNNEEIHGSVSTDEKEIINFFTNIQSYSNPVPSYEEIMKNKNKKLNKNINKNINKNNSKLKRPVFLTPSDLWSQ